MTAIVVVRRLAEEGPGDETGGTANITTSARSCKIRALLQAGCRFEPAARAKRALAGRGGAPKLREGEAPRQTRKSGTILGQSPRNIMTAKRAAGYCGGALLLLAWLSSAGGLMRQTNDAPAPRQPVETDGTTRLADEVQAQADRLRSRLAVAPAPQEPFRNPFAFASRTLPERRDSSARVEGETAAPDLGPPLEPAIELIGVAETESPKGVVRTAIISALDGELFLVKEGETIAARYRVGPVAAGAVELNDLLTGAVRRLALRE
jgi:hypothetical protein